MATRKNRRQKKRKGGIRKSLKVGGEMFANVAKHMPVKIIAYACYNKALSSKMTFELSGRTGSPTIKILNIFDQNENYDVSIELTRDKMNFGSTHANIVKKITLTKCKDFNEFKNEYDKFKISEKKNDMVVPYVELHGVFLKNAYGSKPEKILKMIEATTDGRDNELEYSYLTGTGTSQSPNVYNFSLDSKSKPEEALIDFDVEYDDNTKFVKVVWVWWNGTNYSSVAITDALTNTTNGFWALKQSDDSDGNINPKFFNFNGKEISNGDGKKVDK